MLKQIRNMVPRSHHAINEELERKMEEGKREWNRK